jgi:hypothetical protein
MGGRVTMMVPTALLPVPRVISFHVVVMVAELASVGGEVWGGTVELKSFGAM